MALALVRAATPGRPRMAGAAPSCSPTLVSAHLEWKEVCPLSADAPDAPLLPMWWPPRTPGLQGLHVRGARRGVHGSERRERRDQAPAGKLVLDQAPRLRLPFVSNGRSSLSSSDTSTTEVTVRYGAVQRGGARAGGRELHPGLVDTDRKAECTSRELLPDSYCSKRRDQVTRGIDAQADAHGAMSGTRGRTAPPPRVHAPSTPRLSGLPPDLRTDLERLRGADGSTH